MSKILKIDEFAQLIPKLFVEKNRLKSELNIQCKRKKNGEYVSSCISRDRAIDICKKSDGLYIRKNTKKNGFAFGKFTNGTVLSEGEFAMESDVILKIFSDTKFHETDSIDRESLIFYFFNADKIIFEISELRCNDDGSGGDGVKVRIPTE